MCDEVLYRESANDDGQDARLGVWATEGGYVPPDPKESESQNEPIERGAEQ